MWCTDIYRQTEEEEEAGRKEGANKETRNDRAFELNRASG